MAVLALRAAAPFGPPGRQTSIISGSVSAAATRRLRRFGDGSGATASGAASGGASAPAVSRRFGSRLRGDASSGYRFLGWLRRTPARFGSRGSAGECEWLGRRRFRRWRGFRWRRFVAAGRGVTARPRLPSRQLPALRPRAAASAAAPCDSRARAGSSKILAGRAGQRRHRVDHVKPRPSKRRPAFAGRGLRARPAPGGSDRRAAPGYRPAPRARRIAGSRPRDRASASISCRPGSRCGRWPARCSTSSTP